MSDFRLKNLGRPNLGPTTTLVRALPAAPATASAPAAGAPKAEQSKDTLSAAPKTGSALPQVALAGAVGRVASPAEVKLAVEQAISASFARVPNRPGETRHQLNQRLQASNPSAAGPTPGRQPVRYDGADVVILAFEGTGAFHPRCAPIMQEAAAILAAQGLHSEAGQSAIQAQVSESLSKREGKAMNWSGLAVGPLSGLLDDSELAKHTQWLSFPSEEFEALASQDAYKHTSLSQILTEAVLSTEGETPGINQALTALREIQAQALAQGKNPRFAIVTHSSGGRSAVKFLEKAKPIKDLTGQALKLPLVITIDPVREAHEALLEAGKELLNKGTEHNLNRLRAWANDSIPFADFEQKTVYPPLVRHTSQPESLYKPGNTGKFLNFYQLKDTEGLKMKNPSFGIQGSPVAGAVNQEIHGVGSAGHGEIAYHPQVVKTFVQELQNLLKPVMPAAVPELP